MARRLLVPALLVAGLALTACPPKYPKCDNDEHCKVDGHNEVCVNGMCQECGKDADCKPNFACKDNKCVPKAECSTDGDCSAGLKCRNEKCVGCAADADCGAGMKCAMNRCVPGDQCSLDSDCPSGQRCQAGKCAVAEADTGCQLQTVRFDFNESTLTSDARRVLDANADCMRKRGKVVVTIEGHCDERGTEEYNLHLGERRANAVKKYLTALGVEGASLKTISYGKERPVNPGHDEGAWSENRRAAFTEK